VAQGRTRGAPCAAGIDAALAPVSGVFLVDAPLLDTGLLPAELATAPGGPAPDVGYGRGRCTYIRRQPEHTVLHRVIREHLETFLAEACLRGGGEGLPRFVERQLREFLTCGDLTRGFARHGIDLADPNNEGEGRLKED